MRQGTPSAIALLLICWAVSACDGGIVVVSTGPSGFTGEADFVKISPSVLVWHNSPLHTCSPVALPFTVSVAAGASPLVLSEVRFHSTDRSGSSPAIFDSASLTRRFGSLAVASFRTREFPFAHDFGCAMSGNVVLHVSVTTTDRSGLGHVSALQVPVR